MTLIRITRHHSTKVRLRIGNKPEVEIPVGPIFELDDVPQYTAEELRGALDDSSVEYETVGADAQAGAGSAGGLDALSAVHSKPDPRVSATTTSGVQPESEDRKDAQQPDAYGGELEGEDSDNASEANESDNGDDEDEVSGERREELLALLDQSVPDLVAALEGRSDVELRALRDAERDGKSRKSALEALEAALNPEEDE